LNGKKALSVKQKNIKKDIVPVYIEGRNSNFFYNLARIRQKLGLKANIEMLYLPDELFSQRGKDITIRIGKKIPYTHFDTSKNERQWAAEVKDVVYAMADGKK
jgi:putative hemolysin